MPEKPLTLATLTEFHRRVIAPDIQRIVDDAAGSLRNEMHTLHDSVLHKIDILATEYAAISVALERIETRQDQADARLENLEDQLGAVVSTVQRLDERFARVEARLEEIASDGERAAVRAEVERLRVRVEALHDEIRRIERRIGPSEDQ